MSELHTLTAGQAAREIRERRLSPVELVESILARIHERDPMLSCFAGVAVEQSLEAAGRAAEAVVRGEPLGSLHGVPYSMKDLIDVRGMVTAKGALAFRHVRASADAPAASLMRASGAICVGKTTTPEFGWSFTTTSPLTGRTANPWDATRTAGGSSGGAGAALAAGLGPLAVATDGGGSIRLPASFNGVVGLKPSSGTVPTYPPSDLGTLGHVGPMARCVGDVAILLDVLTGHVRGEGPAERAGRTLPGGLRIAFAPTLNGGPVEEEVSGAVAGWAAELAASGVAVTEVDLRLDGVEECWDLLYSQSIARQVDALPTAAREQLSEELRRFVGTARELPHSAGPDAELRRRGLVRQAETALAEFDLLVMPTTSTVAFDLGLDHPHDIAGSPAGLTDWARLTQVWNLTGFPALSMPAGLDAEDLPIGVQIVGPLGSDHLVLALAAHAESALGPRLPWAIAP